MPELPSFNSFPEESSDPVCMVSCSTASSMIAWLTLSAWGHSASLSNLSTVWVHLSQMIVVSCNDLMLFVECCFVVLGLVSEFHHPDCGDESRSALRVVYILLCCD